MISNHSTWNSNSAEGRALQTWDVAARHRKDVAPLHPSGFLTHGLAADEVEKTENSLDGSMQRAAYEAQGHGDIDESTPQGGGETSDEGTAGNNWQAVRNKKTEGASDGEARAQDVKQKTSDAMGESLEDKEELMFGRKA